MGLMPAVRRRRFMCRLTLLVRFREPWTELSRATISAAVGGTVCVTGSGTRTGSGDQSVPAVDMSSGPAALPDLVQGDLTHRQDVANGWKGGRTALDAAMIRIAGHADV